MTTVTATHTAATNTNTSTNTSASINSSPAISSDFETFLTMLTTQMQNQDPLNPIEGSDYAVQLATFSGVEQQVKTNELLETLTSRLGLAGMSELAGWVGMEARSSAPVWFDGTTPVTLLPQPAEGASETCLVVKDKDGNTVSRQFMPPGSEAITWTGTDSSGDTLKAGLYSFELESYNSDTLISKDAVQSYSRITEAQTTDNGTVLVLKGGSTITTSDVTALRET